MLLIVGLGGVAEAVVIVYAVEDTQDDGLSVDEKEHFEAVAECEKEGALEIDAITEADTEYVLVIENTAEREAIEAEAFFESVDETVDETVGEIDEITEAEEEGAAEMDATTVAEIDPVLVIDNIAEREAKEAVTLLELVDETVDEIFVEKDENNVPDRVDDGDIEIVADLVCVIETELVAQFVRDAFTVAVIKGVPL